MNMTNKNKPVSKKNKTEKPKESKTRRNLKLAFAFIAGSALAGCGDNIVNNHFYGPDGGQKPDTTMQVDSGVKPDTQLPDTSKPDACVVDTSCTVTEEKATIEVKIPGSTTQVATLKEGESYTSSGNTFKVKSIDETVAADSTCAISDKKVVLEITNTDGTTQVTLTEGESAIVSGVSAKALGINVGVNELNCSHNGDLVYGTLNQNESLSIGNYKIVFEDGQQVGDKVYALLKVSDSCGAPVDMLKVEEGKTAALKLDGQLLTVSAYKVAIGLTFATKWTKLSVTKPCETLPSTCSSNSDALKCSDTVPLVSGTLNQDESLLIQSAPGVVKYKLKLDDGQVLNGKNHAIVSLIDSCGNLRKKEKLVEGSTKTFNINGEQFDVTVDSAAFGLTFGAKWAKFTVNVPCSATYWCTSIMGVLDVGDSLMVDSFKIQLDDLHAQGTLTSALLSVLDANGNTLTKLKIAEGSSVDLTLSGKTMRINVPEVAPGYMFGAKWAKLEIQSPYSKPCGS
jgi:hypothetical protein